MAILNPWEWENYYGVNISNNRWIWTLNGTSYGEFPAQSVSPSSIMIIRFSEFVVDGLYDRFIGSSDFTFSVDTGADGDKFRLSGCTATLDGQPIISNATLIPTDSNIHILDIRPTVSTTVSRIGTRSNSTTLSVTLNLLSYSGTGIGVTNYSSGSFNYKLDKPFSTPYFFTDSDNGVVMDTFNVLAEDVVEGVE